MTDKRYDDHFTDGALFDYFGGKLDDAAESVIEEHLAYCGDCILLARQAFSFNSAWEAWTARSHGDAQARSFVAEALAAARDRVVSEPWRERLQRWQVGWKGAAEVGLRLAITIAGDTSGVLGEAVEGLTRPGGGWQFQPEASAAAIRGSGQRENHAVFTTSLSPDEPRARIAVEAGREAAVTVRLDRPPHPNDLPLVLLIRADGGAVSDVRVEQLETRDEQFIARFENVDSGEYIVVLEPLA